jgi:transmembrane sensor
MAQIAEEMGLSVSTVEKHLGVALAAFMKTMAEHEQEVTELGRERDMALQDREAQAIRHLLAIENAEPATAGDDANRARDWIAARRKRRGLCPRRAAWRLAAELDGEPDVRAGCRPRAGADAARMLAGTGLAMGLAAMAGGVEWWRHRGLATGVGEIREVALPDGSRMVLNSTSRVEVAYTPERRLLVLAREAFFDVAHNPQRPFDVQVGATTARAGHRLQRARTRAAGGTDRLARGGGGKRGRHPLRKVPAGNFAIIHPDTVRVLAVDEAGMLQRVAWRDREIVFNGDTLAQAVEEFNRYRAQPIIIGDQRLAALRWADASRSTNPTSS